MLGTFPIIFGLSFRDALLATLAGLLLGAAILAPMSLFGPRNGTNNAVSSSAHLGVHGRVVGSFLSLLTAIAFFSISVWTSGDVLVGGANRAVGLPDSDIAVGVAYGIFALLVLVVCIYGFRFMLLVNKIAVVAATLLFLAGIFAFGGTFDPGYPGTLVAGDPLYLPSFVGAALIVMSNPVSFGAFLGDWSRYIPRDTPSWKPMLAAFLAQIATLVPFLFGLVTATVVATTAPGFIDDGDYVGGLLAVSPGWYFVPVCLIALIGGMSTGTTALYGTGLDFSSVFPRFSRVQATVFIGTLAIVFIFVGRFAFDVVQSISTLRRADRHVHRAVDGGDDDRLGHPSRLVRLGCAAGVQPSSARRPLLVHARLELAGARRLADRGRPVDLLRQPSRPVRRPAGQSGGRRRPQHPGRPRPGRNPRIPLRCGVFPEPADVFGPGRLASGAGRPRRQYTPIVLGGECRCRPRNESVPSARRLTTPAIAGPATFARLPRLDQVTCADVAVVGVPFDAGVSYRPGARFGPAHVRRGVAAAAALQPGLDVSPFAPPAGRRRRRHRREPLRHRRGDRDRSRPPPPTSLPTAPAGDHRRRPHHRAAAAAGGRRAARAGRGACTSTRTWTPGTPTSAPPYTHGTPFRRAVEEGLLDTEALRARRHPRAAVRHEGPRRRPRASASASSPRPTCTTTASARSSTSCAQRVGDRPVYVSIDIDVLDPAHAPGTGTPEAGGLTSRELLEILRGLPRA